MLHLLSCLSSLILVCHCQRSPTTYYGQPLGAVYYAADGTQGEAYAPDAKTISIINFHHKPQKDCTTFIAGPTKTAGGDAKSAKDAILLPIKYRKFGRSKRQSIGNNKQSGIKWDVGSAPGLKNGGINWGDLQTRSAPVNRFIPPTPLDAAGVRHSPPEVLPLSKGNGIKWEDKDDEKPLRPRFFGPLPKPPPGFFDLPPAAKQEARPEANQNPKESLSRRNFASQPLPLKLERSSFDQSQQNANKSVDSQAVGALPVRTNAEIRSELGGIVIHPSGFRRQWLNNGSGNASEAKPNEPPKPTESPAASTPLFVVVDDPRLKRLNPNGEAPKSDWEKSARGSNNAGDSKRRQLLPPAKQVFHDSPIPVDDNLEQNDEKFADEKPKIPVAPEGMFYVLPETVDDELALAIPEPYSLSDFDYFGIYDHCRHVKTAVVDIHGVSPPKEIEVDGMDGWQYDVKSDKIRILDCNTMLITNLTYTGAGKADAYIYAGNGDFPQNIIDKVRVQLVGLELERTLRNKNGQNVYVKLPTGWKTMDISWLAVYNPKENISYGHALIPKHSAPICEES